MKILFSNDDEITKFETSGNHPIFQDRIIDFFDELSKKILKEKRSKDYPDLINFAFFIRKGNINLERENYSIKELSSRKGIGTALLIAPSNVPLNFAFSLVTTLLAGNNNIVRVSDKQFSQVDLFLELLNEFKIARRFTEILDRIKIVSYPRGAKWTNKLSENVNIRLIWGGDETVNFFKSVKTKIRCKDLYFSNRYSCCVFNTEEISKLSCKELEMVYQKFYNDTYLNDQNACSSPKSIFWYGDLLLGQKCSNIFWIGLAKFLKDNYEISDHQILEKVFNFSSIAINYPNMFNVKRFSESLIVLTSTSKLIPENLDRNQCNSGLFKEFFIDDFELIFESSNSSFQTLVHSGFSVEELNGLHKTFKGKGYERFVPLGKSQNFSFRWDGIDLIRHQSRYIELITR
ncbi:hypothetical protein OAG38_07645 [Akkermansiaceae bacterium]|nr:hypothetical protein [Akkermansiaceae bacterium]